MSGFSLLSVAASLLPLVGASASGADQEKGQFVTQVVQERIDPSARMLNIALAEMICGGRGNVCGSDKPVEMGPSTDPNAKVYFVKYHPYPKGSCEREKGTYDHVDTWIRNNCVSYGFGFLAWFDCLFV